MDAPPFTLSTSDRAFLRAVRRSGMEPSAAFWAGMAPSWRVAMRSAWEEHDRRVAIDDAAASLAADHRDELRIDPRRIHPSWFVRALRDESPAVRQSVIRHVGEPLASVLRSAFPVDSTAQAVRDPHPGALAWVLDFWTERLVGGPPASPRDPPAIRVLTTMTRPAILRLMIGCGRLKRPEAHDAPRRELADLGRITLGRLLSRAEPYRVRWALQHQPYELARLLRPVIDSPVSDRPINQEAKVLATAQTRLRDEGWPAAIAEDLP